MITPLQIISDFFIETFNRIRTKSPTFFKRIQLIMALLTFAGYFPSAMQQFFNITVSGTIIHWCELISHYTAGAFFTALLTAKSPIVGQTTEGMEVKVTSEKKMPFTAKAEQKEMATKVPPPEVLEEVPETAPEGKIVTTNFPYNPPKDGELNKGN